MSRQPAEVLQAMRARGESDLDIAFIAIGFIIQRGLTIIEAAVNDVKKVGSPRFYHFNRIYGQIALGSKMDYKLEDIEKYNKQLQSAISIANYSLNLKLLENALDATNCLQNVYIR